MCRYQWQATTWPFTDNRISRFTYSIELTVAFKTNLKIKSDRKDQRYLTLIADQENVYDKVKSVNVSVRSLSVFGESTKSLFYVLQDLKYDEQL